MLRKIEQPGGPDGGMYLVAFIVVIMIMLSGVFAGWAVSDYLRKEKVCENGE